MPWWRWTLKDCLLWSVHFIGWRNFIVCWHWGTNGIKPSGKDRKYSNTSLMGQIKIFFSLRYFWLKSGKSMTILQKVRKFVTYHYLTYISMQKGYFLRKTSLLVLFCPRTGWMSAACLPGSCCVTLVLKIPTVSVQAAHCKCICRAWTYEHQSFQCLEGSEHVYRLWDIARTKHASSLRATQAPLFPAAVWTPHAWGLGTVNSQWRV